MIWLRLIWRELLQCSNAWVGRVIAESTPTCWREGTSCVSWLECHARKCLALYHHQAAVLPKQARDSLWMIVASFMNSIKMISYLSLSVGCIMRVEKLWIPGGSVVKLAARRRRPLSRRMMEAGRMPPLQLQRTQLADTNLARDSDELHAIRGVRHHNHRHYHLS